MDFFTLAKRRGSVRSYQNKPIEPEKLTAVLEAGRVAPTGNNAQPQRILVLQTPENLEKLSKAANIYGAPCAIVVCGEKEKCWVRPYDGKNIMEIDVSIVTDHMMLEAADQGLASVWICYFKPDILRKEFGLPQEWEPVNILALGYPEGKIPSPDRHQTARLPLEQTVFYERIKK